MKNEEYNEDLVVHRWTAPKDIFKRPERNLKEELKAAMEDVHYRIRYLQDIKEQLCYLYNSNPSDDEAQRFLNMIAEELFG
jgi:hypothetical protein